jgi:hypothetical protein
MRKRTSGTAAIYAGAPPADRNVKISIRQQVSLSWNYISEQRLKISHIFVDQSASEGLASRTNFQHMVKEARAGKFGIIVLCGLEYFCSSQVELIAAKESLTQSGVPFHNAIKVDGY